MLKTEVLHACISMFISDEGNHNQECIELIFRFSRKIGYVSHKTQGLNKLFDLFIFLFSKIALGIE